MNTWRITGSTSFVRTDRPAVVGRHVAPAEQHLAFACDRALDLLLAGHARRGFLRQEHHAHAVLAEAGSVIPGLPQARRRKASGIWIRMPAPSPCSGSAPVAPRWVRFLRICSPCVTIAWLFLPLMCAMKPRPQASCSFAGSYRPWRAGGHGGNRRRAVFHECPRAVVVARRGRGYGTRIRVLRSRVAERNSFILPRLLQCGNRPDGPRNMSLPVALVRGKALAPALT